MIYSSLPAVAMIALPLRVSLPPDPPVPAPQSKR